MSKHNRKDHSKIRNFQKIKKNFNSRATLKSIIDVFIKNGKMIE